ncbi:MAG: SBBP repeat-containing protein [Acidobacteria bacterium]|nr:SBBP repeat-containing protein [Acidobacteriota bacterium]
MPLFRFIAVRALTQRLPVFLVALLSAAAAVGQSPEVESLLAKVQVRVLLRGPDGSIYLAGSTESSDLPGTEGTMSPTPVIVGCAPNPSVINIGECLDVFVAKLDSAGENVLFATYLGGTDFETASDLFVDSEGNVYLLGVTRSEDFPTTSTAVQTALGDGDDFFWFFPDDLFIAKISSAGDQLLYSTYLGGSWPESDGRIDVDSDGHIYVTSSTNSPDFPVTEGAYLTTRPDPSFADLLVGVPSVSTLSKIDPAAEVLVYSTYLDRPVADLAIDRRGAAVLAGPPRVLYFSTTGAIPEKGELTPLDAFLATLSPDGATVESVIEFGGSGLETVTDVELDSDENAWITGGISSADLPLTNPLPALSKPEGFIAKLARGGEVLFASHIPGRGRRLALSQLGEAVVLGETLRANVPTTPDAYFSGMCDTEFGMRLSADGDLLYSSYLPRSFATATSFPSSGAVEFLWVGPERLESVRTTDEPPSFACVTHGASTERIDFVDSAFVPYDFSDVYPSQAALSPGAIVDLHGFGWGPHEAVPLELDGNGRVATKLAGARVLFDGVPAPLLSVQDRVIRAIVPFSRSSEVSQASEARMTVEVETAGGITPPRDAYWASASPKIFTLDGIADGQAAVLNEDGSLNSAANPARKGSIIAIFATGAGTTDPPSVDGAITPIGGPFPRLSQPVAVWLGSYRSVFNASPLAEAEVLYAGAAPGLVAGGVQVNARIPQNAPSGSRVRIHLQVGFDLGVGVFESASAPTIAIE